MTRDEAVKAAYLLDRIAGGRYGEKLADVQVGGHLIDLRRPERPERTQRTRSTR